MIYIILLATSLFSASVHAYRSVPQEYVNGIENKLPANYHKLFQIEDKDSPQYTVVAHELTMDLMLIAEQERKSGNMYSSFAFLKLANFLFPHRGDVSKKFQSIAEQMTLLLNAQSTPCNDTYEIFLRELKVSFPAMISQVNENKCELINKAVRDINEDIVTLEKKASDEGSRRNAEIQKQLAPLMGKDELSSADEQKVLSLLRAAYLGHIEFRGYNKSLTSDGELVVHFELIRKYSSISYNGMKQTYSSITGKDSSEEEIFQTPIKFLLRMIQNDKITTYPISIKVNNPTFFNIWLNSFNFFAFSGYDQVQIALQNDVHSFKFEGSKVSVSIFDPFNYKKLNAFEIKGLPTDVINTVKKIDIIPAL